MDTLYVAGAGPPNYSFWSTWSFCLSSWYLSHSFHDVDTHRCELPVSSASAAAHGFDVVCGFVCLRITLGFCLFRFIVFVVVFQC